MRSKSSLILASLLAVLLLLISCAEQAPEQRPQQTRPESQPAAEPDQPSPEPEPEPETTEPSTEAVPERVAAATGNIEAGKAVYDKKCATCHGKDGEAKAAMAQMFKVEMRHLGSSEVQAKSDDELRRDIAQGIGKMKPTSGLNDDDLTNLVAYVRTLK